MAKKQKDIKKYLSSIGKTENLHFLIGKTDNYIETGSNEAGIDLWNNSIFSKRVTRNDAVGVIPNITWKSGGVYYPWKAFSTSNSDFYVWNKENGNVYICLSNNEFNRKDLSGTIASTYIPNHAYGIKKYPDGYTWLPVYRITGDYLRFVKTNWIPIISFEDFKLSSFSTEQQNIENFCNDSIDTSGYCALYFKDNKKIAITGGTFEDYIKGERYKTVESSCGECYYLFDENNTLQPVFYGSTGDIVENISILDKFDEIGQLIADNRIPSSSAFYALYEIANNGPDDGAIISASLNLSDIPLSQLVVNQENPEFTVISLTGSGARIRLKTYRNINGKFIINGIEVIENGKDYKDIILDISSNIFASNIKSQILSSIELNLDIIDGLNVDPYDVLECKNVLIDSRIEIQELDLAGVPYPTEFNLYGLVSNPLQKLPSGDYIVSGSELPPNVTKIASNSIEAAVIYEDDIGTGTITKAPVTGKVYVPTIADQTDLTQLAALVPTIPPSPTTIVSANITTDATPTSEESFVTLIGSNHENVLNSQYVIDTDNEKFFINRIIKEPDLKQYSGKVLQVVKTPANIKIADTNGNLSRIIRINIIREI